MRSRTGRTPRAAGESMKGQFTRLIIFMAVCVIIIAGITAATYAVWTTEDGSSVPATTQTGEWEDASYRYLVIKTDVSDELLRFRQKADDGTDVNAFYSSSDLSAATRVTVVGYEGILTKVVIPAQVTVSYGAGETKTLPVTTIATGTVEQYDGLRIIEKLEIPSTVTLISAYSFMFCDSLTAVTFAEGGDALVLGDKCFYGCVKLSESAVDYGGRTVEKGEYCFG